VINPTACRRRERKNDGDNIKTNSTEEGEKNRPGDRGLTRKSDKRQGTKQRPCGGVASGRENRGKIGGKRQ